MKTKIAILAAFLLLSSNNVFAQDLLPRDNRNPDYFPSPYYRESESHPLRTVGYVLHPIGWTLRELIYRPMTAAIASTSTTRSVFGYRDPFDFRETICFNPNVEAPDCAMVPPYSKISHSVNISGTGNSGGAAGYGTVYDGDLDADTLSQLNSSRQVYFPDIAFEFGKSKLNALGEGRVRQVALLLQSEPDLQVVLEGNTDSRGSDQLNQKLGEQRALTVKSELISLGISPQRLETMSRGKTSPIFTDETEWAHAVNRRVVISVGHGDASNIKAPEQVAHLDQRVAAESVAEPVVAAESVAMPEQAAPAFEAAPSAFYEETGDLPPAATLE